MTVSVVAAALFLPFSLALDYCSSYRLDQTTCCAATLGQLH